MPLADSLDHLIHSCRRTVASYHRSSQQDSDVELEPLHASAVPFTRRAHQQSQPALSDHLDLVQRIQRGQKMKFSHSLLFNSVPEWSSHYVNYEALKSAIYRFEKANLHAPPPTQYTDNPSSLEAGAHPGPSSSSHPPSASTNERVFTRLLDQELHKITEFYVDKERELLADLAILIDDIARIEEDGFPGSGGGPGVSGDGDSDEEEGESDDEGDEGEEGVAAKTSKILKGALQNVFSNPKAYDEATRAGRRSTDGKAAKGKRRRALSNASRESDLLLDLNEEDEAATVDLTAGHQNGAVGSPTQPASALTPTTPSKKLPLGRTMSKQTLGSRRRSISRGGGSVSRAGGGRARAGSVSATEADDGDGFWGTSSDWAIDARIMFKRRITALFMALSELKQFVNLNYTGLSKVLKKYDKITNSSLRGKYMSDVVDKTFPFETVTQERLTAGIQSLVPLYATIATGGDEDAASKQLKAHLREHVVWERNTVWREMIGLERKGWGTAGSSNRVAMDVPLIDSNGGKPESKTELSTPIGRFSVPSWLNGSVVAGSLTILLFLGILSAEWFDRVEEQNCLALLVFVTIFWALEIVPLFVTALMVPFWVVVLGVIRSQDGEDRRLTASESTKYIFGQMFSPTIMLLLGGFTLAAALSKQNIDKVLATKVLSFAGTKPKSVLLAYMCVACFASMWISNVAAPVLCYSLIQPILRTLPAKAPFSKSLILGIALASNIGGMASPISSPQNLIALEYMNPPISWLGWFAVSIPVAFTSIFLIWLILLYSYRSGPDVVINPVRVSRESWTRTQWYVAIVTIATIVLWCVESQLAWLFGDMGIIAIFPLAAFYGTGVLRKADFDHSPWSIVFLAMGGIGLGKAVLSSGLLDDMDRVIQSVVLGLDIWPILALFSVVVLVIATLISHTIASVLVVPIAAQIGAAMEVPHPRLLILATALICSAGMGLPISGFPNLQAINVETDTGDRVLQPSDFFRNGIPASLVATSVIVTLGFGIMRLMGL